MILNYSCRPPSAPWDVWDKRYDVFECLCVCNQDCMFSLYAGQIWGARLQLHPGKNRKDAQVILYLLTGRKTRGTNKTWRHDGETDRRRIPRLKWACDLRRAGFLAVILIDELSRCPEFLCWAKVENSSSLPAFKTSVWDFSNTISTVCRNNDCLQTSVT